MKIIFGLLLVFMSLFADVNWNSYEQMQKDFLNKKIDKPIMLFVGESKCQYCIEYKNSMRNSKDFFVFVNKNYYNVYVNQDQVQINKPYEVIYTPTIFVLNPENLMPMLPEPALGAIEINEMKNYLEKVLGAYKDYKVTKGNK